MDSPSVHCFPEPDDASGAALPEDERGGIQAFCAGLGLEADAGEFHQFGLIALPVTGGFLPQSRSFLQRTCLPFTNDTLLTARWDRG